MHFFKLVVILMLVSLNRGGSAAGLGTVEIIEKYGFPAESHEVVTDDGYILTVHRIPSWASNSKTKTPILLYPGLLCSSADFVVLGNQSLAILLADNGFDVWIGNQRGSTWGRRHLNLDPVKNSNKFFNFSFHEVGTYDIPATIDYVINATGYAKILYLGYSQGGQSFLVMNSLKPEYNSKVLLAVGLAPASYQGHSRSIMFKSVVAFYPLFEMTAKLLNINEIFPHSEFLAKLAAIFCNTLYPATNICLWGIKILTGEDDLIDPRFVPTAFTNFPAGASVKQFLHIAQIIKSNKFHQFDYGKSKNIEYYGQATPPSYDLSKVTVPIKSIFSVNDLLVDYRDVLRLPQELPNSVNATKVSWNKFNHLEFLWSYKAQEFIYDDIILFLRKSL